MRDYAKRDLMIFNQNISEEYDSNGILRFGFGKFAPITVHTIKWLVSERFLEPDNDVDGLIRFCTKYPQVKFHGYAISPNRKDTTVVIEGLMCDRDLTMELARDFVNAFIMWVVFSVLQMNIYIFNGKNRKIDKIKDIFGG